jgi:hypothetical protein
MPTRKRPAPPKQIVYLWGAGATQAELSYFGANVNLLMRDSVLGEGVSTRILKQLPKRWRSPFAADKGTDIEKLISLLVGCNISSYSGLAETIRKLYFEDVCRSLANSGMMANPQLSIAILDLHNNASFRARETLSGIITTNHDGILQFASKEVHGAVNLGIPFVSTDVVENAGLPPILQLHGSFTWQFEMPISVSFLTALSTYQKGTVWIPPSIAKDSKSYPFNKIAAMSYELLAHKCDILRVVGSSLTQNDWNVLSMIFTAQRHREIVGKKSFRIELIMPQPSGDVIVEQCSYLNEMFPIGHLSEGDFAAYKEADKTPITTEMQNPLSYWLKEKLRFHQTRGELGSAPLNLRLAQIVGDAS